MRYLKNTVKSRLRNKKAALGSWLNFPSLETAEIMSKSGFQFLVVDAEHGPVSTENIQKLIMVIEGYKVFPFVRVEKNNPVIIKKVLDMGCYGVIVPMINSLKDAKKAVDSVYYSTRGKRGVGLSRAQGYGLEFQRYNKWHKDNIVLIAQIEHREAIDNLEEILSLKEIDATIVGPYDLSASLGYPGEFDRKEVKNALSRYETISKQYSKPYGYHIVHPDKHILKEKLRKGYTFIAYGIDEIFLAQKCAEDMKNIKGLKI